MWDFFAVQLKINEMILSEAVERNRKVVCEFVTIPLLLAKIRLRNVRVRAFLGIQFDFHISTSYKYFPFVGGPRPRRNGNCRAKQQPFYYFSYFSSATPTAFLSLETSPFIPMGEEQSKSRDPILHLLFPTLIHSGFNIVSPPFLLVQFFLS